MKKRFPRFQILFIGGIFFLLGTNFLAILFPNDNQNHKNYWYSSIGFEIIPSTYADDDDDREDHEDRKRGRENKEDHDDDREDDKENDDDDNYYYTPPVTQPPVDNNTPVTPPASNCQTIYDTVTNASGVSSQVPRQVCDTTLPVVPPTPVTPPVALVPEKVIQKPVTPPVVVVPAPVTPPTSNCQTVYDTVYDTVTTAS